MNEEMKVGNELDALVEVRFFGGTCARCEKRPAAHIKNGVVYCSADCYERIGDFALDDYRERRAHYSTSIADAWLAEERIAELKLKKQYVEALQEIVGTRRDIVLKFTIWALVHATPEQRCLAALKATENRDE